MEDFGTFWEVWKVPKKEHVPEECPYSDIGIFPSGERLAVCPSRYDADQVKEELEIFGPSSRFGETMEDAPYEFETRQVVVRRDE